MKFMYANKIAPDEPLHCAASHLGLFCLSMSHKKDARLIWVNDERVWKEYKIQGSNNSFHP